MNIKNYTSKVPAVQSVAYIEKLLVEQGAKNVMKLYSNKRLTGVAFVIDVAGQDMPFKLPAKADKIYEALRVKVKRCNADTRRRLEAQAERTAWKILAEWIEIQLTMVSLDQADLVELFLGRIYNVAQDKTYFEIVSENNFKQLMPGAQQ